MDSGKINLSAINVITGANNSGKSTLLRALHALQRGGELSGKDVRFGAFTCKIDVVITGVINTPQWSDAQSPAIVEHSITLATIDHKSIQTTWQKTTNGAISVDKTARELQNIAPNHLIIPYFSRRKTAGFNEDVREQAANAILPHMTNLSAQLSRFANPHFPDYQQYASTCEAILGFVVTAIPSLNGQRPGAYLPNRESIDIDYMGEGVPNIVQLLVHLASSDNKLFLIEEPENDIHPKALRALLDLIIKSSERNQFVISTHSNIVVSHLCSQQNSLLLRVQSETGTLPYESKVEAIESTPSARLQVLNDLGYSLADLGLWSGYLILEESSAEFVIRNYLIPFFAPELQRIRTISAGGVNNVEPTFSDLNRLALFLHLEPVYDSKTWVIVDGDDAGINTVQKLTDKYKSWPQGSFAHFSEPMFEKYYPSQFSNQINEVLAISAADKRRKSKEALLRQVIEWLDEDNVRAKNALNESARDVIEHLLRIQEQIGKAN